MDEKLTREEELALLIAEQEKDDTNVQLPEHPNQVVLDERIEIKTSMTSRQRKTPWDLRTGELRGGHRQYGRGPGVDWRKGKTTGCKKHVMEFWRTMPSRPSGYCSKCRNEISLRYQRRVAIPKPLGEGIDTNKGGE